MDVVTQVFEVVTSVITGLMAAIVNAFSGLVEIFWDETTGFTFIGTLLLIGLGFTIVFFAFRFIRNLIRQ